MKWDRVPLSALCANPDDIKCGPFGTQLSKDEFREEGIPLWGIRQVNVGFSIQTKEYLDSQTAKRLKQYELLPGDLVMTRKGTVGNCAVYPADFEPGIMHSDLLRMRADPKRCDSSFLVYQLHHSQDVARQLSLISGGAIMPGINVGRLKQLEVIVPPLAEQKRIAAILDAADALRTKRREAIAQLDALLQSSFLTLFGDPLANPMGWEKPSLLELCSARQWPTISGSQMESSGYPVYGANGQIGYYSKYNHEHPTVLVTCRGATCGTINICPPKCYVTGNAMALDDPDPKRITLSYLEWILRIRGMNDVICGAAQPQITRTGMTPITIPLPPLPLQQKFAAIVESIERQKTTQRAHLAELDALFAALQHRAFRGEL